MSFPLTREERAYAGVNPPELDLECPVCHRRVWSDFADNHEGLAVHLRIHHPEYRP